MKKEILLRLFNTRIRVKIVPVLLTFFLFLLSQNTFAAEGSRILFRSCNHVNQIGIKSDFFQNGFSTIISKITTTAVPLESSLDIDDYASEESEPGSSWAWLALRFFFAGSLLVLFFYHLGLFLFNRKDKSSLFFGFLVLFLIIRLMVIHGEILEILFSDVSTKTMILLRFATTFILPAFFIIYVSTIIKKNLKQWSDVNVLTGISIFATLLLFFLPVEYYGKIWILFRIYMVLACSIVLFRLWTELQVKHTGSLHFFLGFLIFYFALLADLAWSNKMPTDNNALVLGLFIFLIFQSYALSWRVWDFYDKEKNEEIIQKKQNMEFEQLVRVKSEDIMDQKNQLLEINKALEEQREDMLAQSEMMDDLNQLLEQEKKKSDSLLLNILPKNIAQELKLYGKAPTNFFPNVSVLFTDFIGFSETVEKVDPQILVDELHYYFANFDDVIKKYNLEKIKTMGDAYMCAGGLHKISEENDAKSTVMAALEINEFIQAYKEERLSMDEFYFNCRIGIHTGPVVAGVVGKSKFAFDIWGQTVNIAKETESAGQPGKINISESTYQLVKDNFKCTPRGTITIKHDRKIQMYFVEGKK